MDDLVEAARTTARREATRKRLLRRLQSQRGLTLSTISHDVIRDPALREQVITDLVASGLAFLDYEFETGGRPRTTLRLKA